MTAAILSIIPARVRQIVAMFVGPRPIEDDTALHALAVDSLGRMAIACELETSFGGAIPDDEVADWQTVDDLNRSAARLPGLPA